MEPVGMHVAFALFEGDHLIVRGGVRLGSELVVSCYGEHHHYSLPVNSSQASRGSTVELFSGVVIEHRYTFPSCALLLRYFEVVPTGNSAEPFRQVKRIQANLDMPVHESDDWESLQLVNYTLAFSCSPLSELDLLPSPEA